MPAPPPITEEMKLAAAEGIASVVADDELSDEYIIPSVLDRRVSRAVAEAVEREAQREGVARAASAAASGNRPLEAAPARAGDAAIGAGLTPAA